MLVLNKLNLIADEMHPVSVIQYQGQSGEQNSWLAYLASIISRRARPITGPTVVSSVVIKISHNTHFRCF
jgi:hypothetical protein